MTIARPARAGPPPDAGRARSAERPDVATVLRLQRSIGNRRTCMLLRKVRPAQPTPMSARRGEFKQITNAHHPGGLNQKEWSDTLKAAKAALDAARFRAGRQALQDALLRPRSDGRGGEPPRRRLRSADQHHDGQRRRLRNPASTSCSAAAPPRPAPPAFVDAAGNFGVEFEQGRQGGHAADRDPAVQRDVQGRQGGHAARAAPRDAARPPPRAGDRLAQGRQVAAEDGRRQGRGERHQARRLRQHGAARLRGGLHDRLPPDATPTASPARAVHRPARRARDDQGRHLAQRR